MTSIATSALKNMRFPEATRSIASNAQNAVRMTNAKENFANTATSARGKKRKYGLVFENNHKNAAGRYVRYYRSPEFATTNLQTNPMTRESNVVVKLARFSNSARKARFDAAVAAKDARGVTRLLDEQFVPTFQRAADAIRALACRPHGLEAVRRLLTYLTDSYIDLDDVYAVLPTCSPRRAKDLITLFMKFDKLPRKSDIAVKFLDAGLEAGIDIVMLSTVLRRSLKNNNNDEFGKSLARVMIRQFKRHPTGSNALARFVASFRDVIGSRIIRSVFLTAPRPGRIVRWLVEDAGFRIHVEDVIAAIRHRHVPVAIYLASKHQWSAKDKTTLDMFLKTANNKYLRTASNQWTNNARAPAIVRILRETVGLPSAPPRSPRMNTEYLEKFYALLHDGDIILYGKQNTYPPKHVRVQKVHTFLSDVILLQSPNARLHPERVASAADLAHWQRRHGVIRGKVSWRQARWRGINDINWFEVNNPNPLVPPPTHARNRTNYHYLEADAAARTIQAAYKQFKQKNKRKN